jgi:hypothetical protein
MIIKTSDGWKIPRYKITRTVITYDDSPELYDGTAEEIILTAEQLGRLEEIRHVDMAIDQAEQYVLTGEGYINWRGELEKAIDLIPDEKLPEALTRVKGIV